MKKIYLISLLIFAGIASSAVSLVVSLLFFDKFIDNDNLIAIAIFVTVEELAKFIFLVFCLEISGTIQTVSRLFSGAILGLGFALFEIILIFLNKGSYLFGIPALTAILPILIIHISTSLVLSLGISTGSEKKMRLWKTSTFFLLAIIIHLCYNFIVMYFSGLRLNFNL